MRSHHVSWAAKRRLQWTAFFDLPFALSNGASTWTKGVAMGSIEVSTTIDRPVQEVFGVVSHIENNPKWSTMVLEAQQATPEPPGLGTKGTTTGKFLGMRLETELEITEFEENVRFAYRSIAGPVERWGKVTFESVGTGTRVGIEVGGDTKGFFQVADSIVLRVAKRQLQADLDTLKEMMEARIL